MEPKVDIPGPVASAPTEEIQDINYWATRWKEQRTGWHMESVNPTLINYFDRLVHPADSVTKRFFLPLCGKSYDINYILSKGHKVFGVEAVKEVIDDLNTRDTLGLTFYPEESVYATEDQSVIIYIGDILDCPVEKWGPVDIVWDRASLVAMNYADRTAYVGMIQRSVKNSENNHTNFVILLEAVSYPKPLYGGPPRSVDPSDIEELFEPWTDVEILEMAPVGHSFPGLLKVIAEPGSSAVFTYLFTPKISK